MPPTRAPPTPPPPPPPHVAKLGTGWNTRQAAIVVTVAVFHRRFGFIGILRISNVQGPRSIAATPWWGRRPGSKTVLQFDPSGVQIGRASCRERGGISEGGVSAR